MKIVLKPADYDLPEVVIKPKREKYRKKNNPALELVREIIDKREENSPENKDFYSRERHEKLGIALNDFNAEKSLEVTKIQAEKINGEWVQRLTIHYNCIGALFIPDTEPLPVPNVTVNTRRGVYVTYEPAQNE